MGKILLLFILLFSSIAFPAGLFVRGSELVPVISSLSTSTTRTSIAVTYYTNRKHAAMLEFYTDTTATTVIKRTPIVGSDFTISNHTLSATDLTLNTAYVLRVVMFTPRGQRVLGNVMQIRTNR